ncbi:hypothetical protein [uncultured Methanobrevibacter sp.]|uniref:hypothetical protein n=1 Tax=uncultured Methanobrevibacter sp. TaxID=253161 RepID=UPI0025F634F8|nr:hypothetical protein [uncultured Methanobrevibacter sp.]
MNENLLPTFGVEPFLALIIGILKITSSIISYSPIIPVYKIDYANYSKKLTDLSRR